MRLFSASERTLEPYLSQFDVEKLEMASVMGICAGLLGPKSGHVEKVLVFKACLNESRRAGGRQENKKTSEEWDFGVIWVSLWGDFWHMGDFGALSGPIRR